jgi:hypothetical protein
VTQGNPNDCNPYASATRVAEQPVEAHSNSPATNPPAAMPGWAYWIGCAAGWYAGVAMLPPLFFAAVVGAVLWGVKKRRPELDVKVLSACAVIAGYGLSYLLALSLAQGEFEAASRWGIGAEATLLIGLAMCLVTWPGPAMLLIGIAVTLFQCLWNLWQLITQFDWSRAALQNQKPLVAALLGWSFSLQLLIQSVPAAFRERRLKRAEESTARAVSQW